MALNPSSRRRSQPNSRRTTTSDHQDQPQHKTNSIDRSVPIVFTYLVRILILGLGASTIMGTAISIVNPPKPEIAIEKEQSLPPQPKVVQFNGLKLTQVSPELQAKLQTVSQKNINLDPSYLFINLSSGEYSTFKADRVVPSASTIKLPIVVALFQDIDRQKVRLEEKLTIDKKSIAEGSGDLQDRKPGTQVSVLVAATKMMTISDNTATNLLITRLGGQAALNQRFRSWGLNATTLNNPLPDLKGTNVTTASELARTLFAIDRGKIVSEASRSQILSMMSNTVRNTMLPQGLGKDAKIAHKTGDISSLIADVGTIGLPSGKSYIAAVLVKRPHNDPAGTELIRNMSKIAYQYFQPQLSTAGLNPKPTPTPSPGLPNPVSIDNN
jgi:beta-lactamase class A